MGTGRDSQAEISALRSEGVKEILFYCKTKFAAFKHQFLKMCTVSMYQSLPQYSSALDHQCLLFHPKYCSFCFFRNLEQCQNIEYIDDLLLFDLCGSSNAHAGGCFMQDHLSQCQFALVPCPAASSGCTESLIKDAIEKHFLECKFRPEKCQFCNQSFSIYRMQVPFYGLHMMYQLNLQKNHNQHIYHRLCNVHLLRCLLHAYKCV